MRPTTPPIPRCLAPLLAAAILLAPATRARAQTQPVTSKETDAKIYATEIVQRLHDALRLGKPDLALAEIQRPGGDAEAKLKDRLTRLAEQVSGGKEEFRIKEGHETGGFAVVIVVESISNGKPDFHVKPFYLIGPPASWKVLPQWEDYTAAENKLDAAAGGEYQKLQKWFLDRKAALEAEHAAATQPTTRPATTQATTAPQATQPATTHSTTTPATRR